MFERIAVGLDLGQTTDFTALSVVQERDAGDSSIYDVPWLQRWQLGTPYPKIVADVVILLRGLLARFPKALIFLIVDGSGVGRPVVDMFALALDALNIELVSIGITPGVKANFALRNDGAQEWHVPKRDLVGVMQVLIQAREPRRLNIAPGLPDAAVLSNELKTFRMKYTAAANAIFEHREGLHDDLVLSVALPCWALMHGPLGEPFEAATGGALPRIEVGR